MDAIICEENKTEVTKDNIVNRIKVYDWLYILDEVNTIYMYLIIGDEKAMLIDTGYGFTDFRHLITEITDKPLIVALTHGHDDHALGCMFFDEAYLNERDYPLCASNDNPEQKNKQITAISRDVPGFEEMIDVDHYLNETTLEGCTFKPLNEGDVFDLGGITLEAIAIPGHTKGSMAFYCPEKKALFSGDTVMKNHRVIYGQSLEISGEPEEFIRGLGNAEKRDIVEVWPAHGDAPVEKEYITLDREMLIDWAHNADVERDRMNSQPNPGPFGVIGERTPLYKYKGQTMSYNPGHLDQIRKYMDEHDGAVE